MSNELINYIADEAIKIKKDYNIDVYSAIRKAIALYAEVKKCQKLNG